MKRSHMFVGVALAVLAAGVLSNGGHATAAAGKPRRPGLIVGQQLVVPGVTEADAVFLGESGRTHVLSAHDAHHRAAFTYYSRQPGGSTFTKQPIPLSIRRDLVGIKLLRRANTHQIEATAYNCNGFWTAQTSAKSRRLPTPKLAYYEPGSRDSCFDDVDPAFHFDGEAALPHGRLMALTDDEAGTYTLRAGHVGSAFHVMAAGQSLPDVGHIAAFFGDPSTYEEFLVGNRESADELTDQIVVSTRMPGGQWSSPVQIASFDQDGAFVADEQALAGRVAIAIELIDSEYEPVGLALFTRSKDGAWQPQTSPSGSSAFDSQPKIALTPDGVDIAYVHGHDTIDGFGRLYLQRVTAAGWSKRRPISRYGCLQLDSLQLGRHGKPTASFQRYANCVQTAVTPHQPSDVPQPG